MKYNKTHFIFLRINLFKSVWEISFLKLSLAIKDKVKVKYDMYNSFT